MVLNAGELREVLEFSQEFLEPNGSGGYDGGWIPLVTTRGSVRRLRGQRNLSSGQIQYDEGYEIKTRYRVDVVINPRVKITHRGKDIILHSVMDEDFTLRVFTYYGFADAKGPVNNGPDIQLYETGEPQLYEDGSIQYYES